VGCNQSTTAAVLECMRGLDASAITPNTSTPQLNYFQPVVDGDFLEDQPLILLKKGRYASNVTVVMGYNADEGTFMASSRLGFKGPKDNITEADFLLGAKNRSLSYWLTDSEINQVLDWYSESTAKLGYWYGLAKILGDFYIICPSVLAAPYLVDHAVNETIYTYVWNHTSTNGNAASGASHGNELVYVFNSTVYSPGYTLTAVDLALSYRMIHSWSNIATEGRPQAGWPAYNATSKQAFLWQQSTVDYDLAQAAEIPFAKLGQFCNKWASYFNVSSAAPPSSASSTKPFFSSFF
jgi:carboxylesterase type B